MAVTGQDVFSEAPEFPLVQRARAAGVFGGRSALIAAPTATGKSHIGQRVIIEHFERGGEGLCAYLVPFRALAWEIYETLAGSAALSARGLRVRIATGDATDPIEPARTDVLVATYERFAALTLRSDLRAAVVVVDEVHLIADETRGPPLEMLLAHLRSVPGRPQILALSAVIGDPARLAGWLGLALVEGSAADRQVPVGFEAVETPDVDAEIAHRIGAIVRAGDSVLVFCHSKPRAQALARSLALQVRPHLDEHTSTQLAAIAQSLRARDVELGADGVAELLLSGVAFHHAGLIREVRLRIEGAFRQRLLRVIACTPTLAAGVNLPADVVILDGARRHEIMRGRSRWVPLPHSEILNMLGRAGRPGRSRAGRGVVVVDRSSLSSADLAALREALATGRGEPVASRMPERLEWIMRLILITAAHYGEVTQQAIGESLAQTFWAATGPVQPLPERALEQDLMEDIPAFHRAKGLKIISHLAEPDGVCGRIQSGPRTYDFALRVGEMSCGCPARSQWQRQSVCKHLAKAIHALLFEDGIEPEARQRAKYACLHLFRDTLDLATLLREAADILVGWQLLDRAPFGFRLTAAGNVAANCGLDLLLVTHAFRRIAAAPEGASVADIACWAVDDYFGEAARREHWLAAMRPWLSEEPEDQFPLPTRYRGDFERGLDDLGRVAALYGEAAAALGKPVLAEQCRLVRACLRHGVRPDALPLVALNIPQLGRRRCRQLLARGINSLARLAAADPAAIADRQVAPAALCRAWIERARQIQARIPPSGARGTQPPAAQLDALFSQFRIEPVALARPE